MYTVERFFKFKWGQCINSKEKVEFNQIKHSIKEEKE
jgi:hypothetical protein